MSRQAPPQRLSVAAEAAETSATPRAAESTVSIPVQPPFPWTDLLRSLKMRLIPGWERIEGDCYVRLGPEGDSQLTIRYDVDAHALQLQLAAVVDTANAAARASRLFRPSFDSQAAAALGADPLLGPRIAAVPGLRPLGGWDEFELCVRTLVGQQVSVKAAHSLIGRVVARCGVLDPEHLAVANLERIGMPGRRVAAIQGFAAAVRDGRVDLAADWRELDDALAAQPGFGPWTRGYLGIRLGRDSDAFPAGDAGLLRAAGTGDAKALEKMAERWRPHRALAATYLWMVPAPLAGEPQ